MPVDDQPHRPLSPGTVIAYAGIPPAPWRNGGGTTREIASGRLDGRGAPEIAPGEEWDWRLSIAEVESEGPFSAFPGMTRILTVIEGAGLVITVDGTERQLDRFRPLRFDGGAATGAALPAGPIRDLNLMVRTGTVRGQVAVVELAAEHPRKLLDGQLCVLLRGPARLLAGNGGDRPLERHDTVVGGGHAVSIGGSGMLAIVSLEPGGA